MFLKYLSLQYHKKTSHYSLSYEYCPVISKRYLQATAAIHVCNSNVNLLRFVGDTQRYPVVCMRSAGVSCAWVPVPCIVMYSYLNRLVAFCVSVHSAFCSPVWPIPSPVSASGCVCVGLCLPVCLCACVCVCLHVSVNIYEPKEGTLVEPETWWLRDRVSIEGWRERE